MGDTCATDCPFVGRRLSFRLASGSLKWFVFHWFEFCSIGVVTVICWVGDFDGFRYYSSGLLGIFSIGLPVIRWVSLIKIVCCQYVKTLTVNWLRAADGPDEGHIHDPSRNFAFTPSSQKPRFLASYLIKIRCAGHLALPCRRILQS